jgi:hypothetical protein
MLYLQIYNVVQNTDSATVDKVDLFRLIRRNKRVVKKLLAKRSTTFKQKRALLAANCKIFRALLSEAMILYTNYVDPTNSD